MQTFKKILFIGPHFKSPKGGVAFVLSEYKKLYPKSYFIASTHHKNRFTKITWFACGLLKFLFLMLCKKRIRIIHIHGASYHSFTRKYIFFRIAKHFRKKVIYHVHGAEYKLFYLNSSKKKQRIIENFINNVDCLVCLSFSWQIFFKKHFLPRRIEIIPNIIQDPKTSKQEKNEKQTATFLYLGYVGERKGIWLLLEVLHKHKNELKNKAVFKVGGNGETKKMQELIKLYELTDFVHYCGWISGEVKRKFLSQADVFLLPSYNEGLPISILEAMSYGLPILSTNVGGIPEIVNDSNGKLIEPGNKEQLWTVICFFINSDKTALQKMGQHSYANVSPYLPNAVFEKLNTLYQSMV